MQINSHKSNMVRVMRNPAFCICENKGADQLHIFSIHSKYDLSTSSIQNSLATFCGCTAWFASDLVVNPKDRFFGDVAHM